MTITEQQADAYFAAEYRVFAPGGTLVFRARGHSPGLAVLHKLHNVSTSAFITAYCPSSRPTEPALNRRNQERLVTEVNPRWKHLSGEGADPGGKWPPEPSLLVLGISLQDALRLGREFGQNAIVFADAEGKTDLYACDPENQALLIR